MPNPAGNGAVALCNAALLALGADELASFVDETREAKLCNSLYPIQRDALLVVHPWKFSLEFNILNRLDEVPLDTRWEKVYQLPSECLHVLGVADRTPYALGKNHKLYSNQSEVGLLYQVLPDEANYSPPFYLALQYRLMAVLAMALKEDLQASKEWMGEAKTQTRVARFVDSNQVPPAGWPESAYSIITARYTT
jgi:hypothetical protein